MVFDARYIYGLRARSALIASADFEIEQARINTTENITKAYYGAMISQQAYTLLKQNEDVLKNILNETTATYNEGLIDELSVNRLELNLSNLQTQIEKQENQWENALLNLKYVIGMPNDSAITLTENFDDMVENFGWSIYDVAEAFFMGWSEDETNKVRGANWGKQESKGKPKTIDPSKNSWDNV